jgi:hypothetical protein
MAARAREEDRHPTVGRRFEPSRGSGRHGVLHEEHFFELAGEMTVEVDFAVSDDEADRLLASLREEKRPRLLRAHSDPVRCRRGHGITRTIANCTINIER